MAVKTSACNRQGRFFRCHSVPVVYGLAFGKVRGPKRRCGRGGEWQLDSPYSLYFCGEMHFQQASPLVQAPVLGIGRMAGPRVAQAILSRAGYEKTVPRTRIRRSAVKTV